MELTEAADAIREKLIEHRMSRTTNLWSTILKQIRKQDAFDGQYVDTILEIIRSFLSQLARIIQTAPNEEPPIDV